MSARVLIHVQHLLGVGHLSRMAILADALDQCGMEVTLVSGGAPAPQIRTRPGVRVKQLPPLRAADATFTTLLDGNDRPIDDMWRRDRCRRLLDLYEDTRPDALIVELFPFGRRQLAFELLPLLEMARQDRRCRLVVSSVRDILNRRPKREAEALEWFRRYFSLLLVHADPELGPITDSVPGLADVRERVRYTGLLTRVEPASEATQRGAEILVAAGGGAVGEHLFEMAAAARPLSAFADAPWRFRHHTATPPDRVAHWQMLAGPGAVFETVAPDFVQHLATCRLAICQCGYNTACELLATGTPAVLVPFAEAGETEQTRRAAGFMSLGYPVLPSEGLTPVALAAAIDRAADQVPPAPARFRLDGAARSASIIATRLST